MEFLFTGEAGAEAAAGVFAVVLGAFGGFLFRGGLAEADAAQALGTAEGIFLEAQSFFDGHALPAIGAAVGFAVPALDFDFYDLIHN